MESSRILRNDTNPPAIQKPKWREKVKLNLHSLSESVSELLEYGRKTNRIFAYIAKAHSHLPLMSGSYSKLPLNLNEVFEQLEGELRSAA